MFELEAKKPAQKVGNARNPFFCVGSYLLEACLTDALFFLCFGSSGNGSQRAPKFGERAAKDTEREVPTGPDPLHHHFNPKVRP